MSDITVITSITVDAPLRNDQNTNGARFVAYVSKTADYSATWEQRPAYNLFKSDRRNSRPPKILSHQHCETSYSIWLDGNIALLHEPRSIIEDWLQHHDLAVFKHPERDCLYEEGKFCALQQLDEPSTINAQMDKYAADGFPTHKGLGECGVIARRHTPKVIEFNNMWWSEYCMHSVRDQISFMYAVDKVGIDVNFIAPSVRTGHPAFHYGARVAPQPETKYGRGCRLWGRLCLGLRNCGPRWLGR